MDMDFITGAHDRSGGAVNLGDWAWAHHTTDRTRAPVRLADADVFHIYNIALSYLFCPPRTFSLADIHVPPSHTHTTWADLLEPDATVTQHTAVMEGEYGVEAITAVRLRGGVREYLVHWRKHEGGGTTWEKEHRVKHTHCLERLMVHTPEGATNVTLSAHLRKRKHRDPSQGDEEGSAAGGIYTAVRLNIFKNLMHSNAPRAAMDTLYSVLMDALPVGNGRCGKRGPYHKTCVCCSMTRGCMWHNGW